MRRRKYKLYNLIFESMLEKIILPFKLSKKGSSTTSQKKPNSDTFGFHLNFFLYINLQTDFEEICINTNIMKTQMFMKLRMASEVIVG